MQFDFEDVAVRSGGRETSVRYSGTVTLEWDDTDDGYYVETIATTLRGEDVCELDLNWCPRHSNTPEAMLFWALAEGILADYAHEISYHEGQRQDDEKETACERRAEFWS